MFGGRGGSLFGVVVFGDGDEVACCVDDEGDDEESWWKADDDDGPPSSASSCEASGESFRFLLDSISTSLMLDLDFDNVSTLQMMSSNYSYKGLA